MSRISRFEIVEDYKDRVVLRDLGPWDKHLTITNDAERVVIEVAHMLAGRRLFYYDSEGEFGELLVKDGKFGGFA